MPQRWRIFALAACLCRLHSWSFGALRGVKVPRAAWDDKINLPAPRPIHDPSEAGDWEEGGGAESEGLPRWFLELNVAGFEPDLRFYSNFIEDAARRGDLRAAERWLQNARKAGVDADGETFSFLCLAASKSDLSAAAEYAEKAAMLGSELDEALLSELLARAVKEMKLELADTFYSLSSLDQPSESTFESILRAAAAGGDLETASAWLTRAAGSSKPIRLSLSVMVSLMDAAAKMGNLTMAEAFFKYGQRMKVQHPMASYNILIKAAAEANLPEAAEYWFSQLRKQGFRASLLSYTSLVKAAARAGDLSQAEAWLQRARREGKTDIMIFTAVMDAAARRGSLSAAERWFREAQEEGLAPNLVTFNTVISAAGRAGDRRAAERWFRR
ncbi:unnamed protein product, partial [Effrenium voratum]